MPCLPTTTAGRDPAPCIPAGLNAPAVAGLPCDDSFYELFPSAAAFDLSNSAMTMILAGSSYFVVPGLTSYVTPSVGALTLSLGDDDQATVTLGTPLPHCGGVTTSLTVCSNGFVSVDSGNGTGSAPSASAMLAAPRTAWWSWRDFDPAAGGGVKYEEVGAIAYVTWESVPDFGGTGGVSTFQFQFELATGNVSLVHEAVSQLGGAHLVGYSTGGFSTDPGAIDISVALGAPFQVACTECEAPFFAAFVFDRSDEMLAPQGNGFSRAANSVTAATANGAGDIDTFFADHPNGVAQVYEFSGATANQIGGPGSFCTTAAATKAAVAALSPLASGKPLADALCKATNGLVALAPSAPSAHRKMFLYCCGGDDGSDVSSCRGVLPDATTGNRCAQMPADTPHPFPFSTGSWQEAVCTIVHNDIELHAYYWDDFADVVPQADFVAALGDVTGGTFHRTWDSSTGPVVKPWRVRGVGCRDHGNTRLSMFLDGLPQVGSNVHIGCRTSPQLPYVLGVGLQDATIGGAPLPFDLSPLGAPGCRIYTSWDATDLFVAWSGTRTFVIPPWSAIVGLTLHWQAVQLHPANNLLGVATSNLLRFTIVP